MEHKIQSGALEEGLDIHLLPVVKLLGTLRKAACPSAFLVSFKLETDIEIIEKKARGALERYGMDCVVANLLEVNISEFFRVDLLGIVFTLLQAG